MGGLGGRCVAEREELLANPYTTDMFLELEENLEAKVLC
jgi:hypothetical protein